MGHCWKREKKGQYSDDHEQEDVVKYWQHVFLPAMAKYGETTRKWNEGGEVITEPNTGRHTIVWFHDKLIFYAHDRRKVCWVHDSETAKPYAKGEGPSVMVADFVSADYGWLKGGNHVARVLLRPGSNHNGYFTNNDVIRQASNAMRILTENYPDDDHVLVFNNAHTHSKCTDNALSALKMLKGSKQWGVTVNAHDESGTIIFKSNGKPQTTTKHMADTTWNGQVQCLYYSDDHPQYPGYFKGMARILEE